MVLAERNPDATIVVSDVSPVRLDALRDRLKPLGDRMECRLADATQLRYGAEFDLVLADVPCSGTGTLGRNPEIRHRLTPAEFARQAERQKLILSSALRAAQPGGVVVYSTCSLEPEENEQVIGAVLSDHATARVLSMKLRLEQMEAEGILIAGAAAKLNECIAPDGYLRLFPGMFGTDGFFVTRLQKS
jgi:16S rRNA (cytosine967-C5)-methyltransferase